MLKMELLVTGHIRFSSTFVFEKYTISRETYQLKQYKVNEHQMH